MAHNVPAAVGEQHDRVGIPDPRHVGARDEVGGEGVRLDALRAVPARLAVQDQVVVLKRLAHPHPCQRGAERQRPVAERPQQSREEDLRAVGAGDKDDLERGGGVGEDLVPFY